MFLCYTIVLQIDEENKSYGIISPLCTRLSFASRFLALAPPTGNSTTQQQQQHCTASTDDSSPEGKVAAFFMKQHKTCALLQKAFLLRLKEGTPATAVGPKKSTYLGFSFF